jgi:hypothetical protein
MKRFLLDPVEREFLLNPKVRLCAKIDLIRV